MLGRVPSHVHVKSRVDVVRDPPVATEKYLGIYLGDLGQLAMPGRKVLDRVADDGGQADGHAHSAIPTCS